MESKKSKTMLMSEKLKEIQASNAAIIKLPPIEVSSDILDQITSNKWYRYEDIVPIGKQLCRKYGFNEYEQFDVIGSINQLKNTSENEKPKFIIFNKNGCHWVVCCSIRSNNKVKIFYKDSFCEAIPEIIMETFRKIFSCDVEFISHEIHEKPDQEDGHSCGPMALKNLEIMMKNIKEGEEDFISNFLKIKFCRQKDISSIKTDLKLLIVKPLIEKELQDFSPGDDFKKNLSEFFKLTMETSKLSDIVEEYSKVMKDEYERKENDTSYEMDQLRLEEAKKKFNEITKDFLEKNGENVEQFLNLYSQKLEANKISQNKIEEKNISENSANDNKMLECEIKDDLAKFTNIFKLLKDVVETDELKCILEIICEKFELNYDDLIKFVNTQGFDKSKCAHEEYDMHKPSDINELSKKLPQIKKNINQENSSIKSLDQILAEISFGMDDLSQSNNDALNHEYKKNDKNGIRVKLKEDFKQYQLFKEKYKNMKVEDIRKWASNHNRLISNAVPEAIAVMFSANYLATGGQELRIPQVISLLTFLNTGNKQGKICQINTGEGKTVIISLLAATKVLQGMQVDVITSNEILAAEGVNDRKLFYDILGITCKTNNMNGNASQNLARECYGADVVYGTIANFQFDYLRDSFEKFGTRYGRTFGCAVLDEVDNMTIDNGSYIAKLAAPFPGMDFLRYIYIKIWQELYKADKELSDDFKEECEIELKQIKNDENAIQDEQINKIHDLFKKLKQQIKSSIKLSEPERIELIPTHLKQYSEDMIDIWIDNALTAKYQLEENEQYLIKHRGGEMVIIPIDYQNTGVTLKNSIWCNGLHQFVQLKHNLRLTTESLTCCFISNIGYLKLYKNNIFGMTGTLGSIAEQELLSKMYELDYAKIPTYKQRLFKEEEGIVIEDKIWNDFIALISVELALRKRSVLIICKTIRDLNELEQNVIAVRHLKNFNLLKVKTYRNEDSSNIVEDEIGSSEIIIATNIAGRGTDFKTSSELEENGGLHVCITFLPYNQRVEDQAFGRTSRQGNQGTAQIIMKKSEVAELNIEVIPQMKFSIIKEARDILEKSRLEEIKTKKLIEIGFQDELFMNFSNFYNEFKKRVIKEPGGVYVAEDLKESWAHWFHKKKINNADLSENMADTEFEDFKKASKNIIEDKKIKFNPFYSIQQAGYFLSNGFLKEAELALNHAISLSEKNSFLLYSAYFKLFEVAIEKGGVIKERIKGMLPEVLKKVIFLNDDKDSDYKKNAMDALEAAIEAFNIEINYFEKCFFYLNESENEIQFNKDFHDILLKMNGENFLVENLKSRYLLLNTYNKHAESLLENLKKCSKNDGIYIKSRSVNFMRDYICPETTNEGNQVMNDREESEKIPMLALKKDEILDFESVGNDTMYALGEVQEVPSAIRKAAFIQITAGISAFLIGGFFPPMLVAMSSVGSTLIAEGFSDLAIAVINPDNLKFDTSQYIKRKCWSIGISLLVAGVSTIVSSTRFLDKVINGVRGLASFLRQCPYLRYVLEALAGLSDLFATGLTKFQVIICKINDINSGARAFSSFAISLSSSYIKTRNFVIDEKQFQQSKQNSKYKTFSDVYDDYVKKVPSLTFSENSKSSSKNDKNLQREETDENELIKQYPKVNKVKDFLIQSLNNSDNDGKYSISCDINHLEDEEKYDSYCKNAHEDIMKIVSNEFEQFIVANIYCDMNTIQVCEYGKEYLNNGRSPIVLNFISRSELEGSFDISNETFQFPNGELIFNEDINGLYNSLERQFQKQGFSLTAGLLKDIVQGNDSSMS